MSDSIERNSGAPFIPSSDNEGKPPMSMTTDAIAAMPWPYREWFAQAYQTGVSRRRKADSLNATRAIRFAQARGWHIIDNGDHLVLLTGRDVRVLC